jgi:hypothetical protein
MVDVTQRYPGLAETVIDSMMRVAAVVLLARKSLFLSGSDNTPVLDEGGSAIVVKGRYTEDTNRTVSVRRGCK